MPEGDTIYRTATVLRRVLLGQCLTGFETTVRQVAMVSARSRWWGGSSGGRRAGSIF